MVAFSSLFAFNYLDFDLHAMFADVRSLKKPAKLDVGGQTYMSPYVYDNVGKTDFMVGGPDAKVNVMGYVFGKATCLSAGSYSAGDRAFRSYWTIDHAVLDLTKISAAALSVSKVDDGLVFKSIFAGKDTITLSSGNDFFCGFAGDDQIYGRNGHDFLAGDTGIDHLIGGYGADMLAGGAQRDYFVFDTVADSTVLSTGRDTILDFARYVDKIDLSHIDANTHSRGDQGFVLHPASYKHANDVWYVKVQSDVLVYGDVDGDARADFSILVKGVGALSTLDFLL